MKWAWLLGFILLVGVAATLFVERSKDQKDKAAIDSQATPAPTEMPTPSTQMPGEEKAMEPPADMSPANPPATPPPQIDPGREANGQFGGTGMPPSGNDPGGFQAPPGSAYDPIPPPNYDALPPPPSQMYPDPDNAYDGDNVPQMPPQFDPSQQQPVPGFDEFTPPVQAPQEEEF